MKMLRVGIDVRLWNETGVGRYIRNLIEELYLLESSNEYVLFSLEKDREQLLKKFNRSNWKIVTANIHWHTIAEQTNFPKIIEKEHIEVMHFTYFSVPFQYKGKFIVTMHDMIPFEINTGKASTLPFPLYSIKKTAYKYIVTKALKRAENVIVPTRSVKEDILKKIHIDGKKIEVIYEGTSKLNVSNEKNKTVIEQYGLKKNHYFLYVGNAYPHKNIETLLDAFLQFNSKNPNFALALIGKKDYFYKRLLDAPVAKALAEALCYIESPNDAQLYELYKNAAFFISVSKMEGFALPALEAMNAGVPLVLSDIPVFQEVCKGVPLAYVDPLDSRSICNSLEKVINSPNKTKEDHIKLGKMLAASYSWKRMASQTLKIYDEFCDSSSA